MAEILTTAHRAEEQIEDHQQSMITLGLGTAGASVGAKLLYDKYGKEGSNFSNFYQKLLGTGYLSRQLDQSITWKASNGSTFSSSSTMKSILSQLMAVEEASPLHLLRTLQLSNIFSPFVNIAQSQQEIIFSERKLRNQTAYYEAMIRFANQDIEEKLKNKKVSDALTRGMIFKNGTLYGRTESGKIDLQNVLARSAKLSLSNISQGHINSPNLMFLNYSRAIGAPVDLDALKGDPLIVMGAKSNAAFGRKWGESWLRYATETGMKSLDDPLGGVEDLLKSAGLGHTSFFDTKMWKKAKQYSGLLQLGTGGEYNLPIRESLRRSAVNMAVRGGGAILGYNVLDQMVRGISPSGSLFDDGIYTGLTNLYGSTKINIAKIWSDRFQGYKEQQEQSAPGSTDLMKLSALPAAGALFGAQLSYFQRISRTAAYNADVAANTFNIAEESPLLSKIGIKAKLKPMQRNSLIGALAGSALALPFLPGALVGTSSEELKELYSGKKEVEVKANRWWLFGGNAWEGSHTQYFSKHNIAKVNADATDKVRYGDDATKASMNPFLHPFSYLANPYRYEEMHQLDAPYPIWGLDINAGSIFGKVFERTIGQVIKPDVVNPNMYTAQDENQNRKFVGDTVVTGIKALEDDAKESGSVKEGILRAGYHILFGNKEKRDGSIQSPVQVSAKDRSLINSGLLAPPQSARFTPIGDSIATTYQSATDLVGLKGWLVSLPLAEMGIGPESTPLQLARSGEATSAARDFRDANLGDLFGLGELQRKVLGTSSALLPDRLNPLKNNSAYWLPHDDVQYYVNFGTGNPYEKIKNGEERLPGVGYAALNPETAGQDPNDYSLTYRYKILADVAKGSREHIRARQDMLEAYTRGDLTNRETEILEQTLEQEVQRDRRKTFYEPAKGEDLGPIGYIQSTLWDGISKHAESPTEMLTPIRPIAKFLHNRTAIQDYVETQIGGPDTGIWTNPYSHFLKPAVNKARTVVDSSFRPKEKVEKDNIDEYFDSLDLLKKRKDSNLLDDYSTTVSSSLSGLNTVDKVMKFRKSLDDSEKDYFDSFSKETDEGKRNMIRSIVPDNVRRGYEQIWKNVDLAQETRERGGNIQRVLAGDMHIQTAKLKKVFNVDLTSEDKDVAKRLVDTDQDSYSKVGFSKGERIKYTRDEILRLKMAEAQAYATVERTTGVPDDKFLGWDPRLKIDDIKIRTLSVGGEDLKRFGFWKGDEERMERLPALRDDEQVIPSLSRIKRELRENVLMKKQIEHALFKEGFNASRIQYVRSNYGSLDIRTRDNGDYDR